MLFYLMIVLGWMSSREIYVERYIHMQPSEKKKKDYPNSDSWANSGNPTRKSRMLLRL